MPRKMKVTQGAGRGWENHAVDPSCRVQRGDAATVPVRASFSPSPQSSLPLRALAFWPHTGPVRIAYSHGWVGDSSLAAPSQSQKKNVSIAPTGRQRCIAMHRIDSSCLVTCTAGEDSQKKKKQRTEIYFKACENYRGFYGVPAPHGSVRSVGRLP
jgi:hypothetical protein